MNLNWSNRVIKYVLFVFNFLFVISGIIMIAVGVSVKEYYTDYDIFLSGKYFSLPNLLIAIGSLIFFISFFGCCGAIRESWFMIFIFSILLSFIFIMEFSAGIAGYVLRDQTSSFLQDSLKKSMADYQFNPDNKTVVTPTTIMWDEIQIEFECCGAKDASDWRSFSGPAASIAPPTSSSTESTTITDSTDKNTNPASSTEESSPPTADASSTIEVAPGPASLALVKEGTDSFDLPASCCKNKPGSAGNITCRYANTDTAIPYTKGCVDGFGAYLKRHAVTLGGVGIAIAFIQLFGVIFACHLSRQLKHGFHST